MGRFQKTYPQAAELVEKFESRSDLKPALESDRCAAALMYGEDTAALGTNFCGTPGYMRVGDPVLHERMGVPVIPRLHRALQVATLRYQALGGWERALASADPVMGR